MILEEAYSSNPKPDKQARLEIVQRVSLNEKEVQVNIYPSIAAAPSLGGTRSEQGKKEQEKTN